MNRKREQTRKARAPSSPSSERGKVDLPYKSDNPSNGFGNRFQPAIVLTIILSGFLLLQCLLPLGTAIKIGADEGFELAKATLCLKGYKLYTEIWNDQPPLDTFLVTQILKHISPSILGPRLLTTACSLILLGSIFFIALRFHGLFVAALTTTFVIGSPGFMELSGSAMQEIPALAPAVVALALLLVLRQTRWHMAELLAGFFFAVALEMKFIGIIYIPLAGMILWLRQHPTMRTGSPVMPPSNEKIERSGMPKPSAISRFFPPVLIRSLFIFAVSLMISFVGINFLLGEGAFLVQLKQSWGAHFGSVKSFEYGSRDEYPFQWSVLLKNWDATIPAFLGIILSWRVMFRTPALIVPLAWFALTLVVFARHKPWWSYYYVHNAVPLCWWAAIGVAGLYQQIRKRHKLSLQVLFGIFGFCIVLWIGARVYLQITNIRHSPRIFSALVLHEIERLKPFTKFIYTDEPIYSFHTGLPLPPKLGVISLKRFWSGDMTNARLSEELWAIKPEVILLGNSTQELPFVDLLNKEYRLIYQDNDLRLYALKVVLAQAKP